MRLQWECVDAANCAFRPVGCLAPRSRYSKITSLHRGSKSAVRGEKKEWMQRKRKGFSLSRSKPPLLASLSLTWDCKPLAHCSKDREAPHRQHDLHIFPRITAWRAAGCHEPGTRSEEKTKKIAEMMARIQNQSTKHLTMCLLSSLPLSITRPLSSGQHCYREFGFAYQNDEKNKWQACVGDDRYRPREWSVKK